MIKATECFDLVYDNRRFARLVNFLYEYGIEFEVDQFWTPSEEKIFTTITFDAMRYKEAKFEDSLD